MADLFSTDRQLTIMRHQRDKLVAEAQILSREIRIKELQEEMARCQTDIDAQRKLIEKAEFNITQQQAEIQKEQA